MKKFIPLLLLVWSSTWAAQEIQQSSVDALLSSPEATDVLMHLESWRFTSTSNGKQYTLLRGIFVQSDGSKIRRCYVLQDGVIPDFTNLRWSYWNFKEFWTNGVNFDVASMNWCVQ